MLQKQQNSLREFDISPNLTYGHESWLINERM